MFWGARFEINTVKMHRSLKGYKTERDSEHFAGFFPPKYSLHQTIFIASGLPIPVHSVLLLVVHVLNTTLAPLVFPQETPVT